MAPPVPNLSFDNNDRVRELAGEFGSHLTLVGQAFQVEVTQRGTDLWITSRGGDVDLAGAALAALYELVEAGFALHPTDVQHALRLLATDPTVKLASYFNDTVIYGMGRKPVVPRTPGQRAYVHAMRGNTVVFGVGPAGTGKTFLSVAMAAAALQKGLVKRIILTRPAVEAGEKLGFLPGDLNEKVDPYLRPLYDSLEAMMPAERMGKLLERKVIEVAPLAFMRGRTLSDAYVLLDEAQNTTRAQMRMFLTRLGSNSRVVVNGDVTQVDLPRGVESGMVNALRLLHGVSDIGVVEFGPEDVIRHPLVADIIRAYERDDQSRRDERDARQAQRDARHR